MRVRTMTGALTIAAMACGSAHSANLAGDALKDAFAGKKVYLATPFGGEFPLNYRESGVVDGSGKAVGLGRFVQPTDSGRWWVEGERLCQKWRSWYDGRRFCFTVQSTGPNRISWIRDDGLKGTARIEP